jgi:N-acetylated-alpha-linked acidic dipeptidase
MISSRWVFAVVFAAVVMQAQQPPATEPLQGYSHGASAKEVQWEQQFRAIPSPDNLRAYMKRLSAYPHNVGSPYDKNNAEWIAQKFRSWGFDTSIETFYVLFPTPRERELELIEPTKFTAKLEEPSIAVDPTSDQQAEALPPYNAYSVDGDVTAPLVYVNYGTREDYKTLARMGISVKGAIVIARYGHAWRGIKPKVAAEHGAVGCILYSDPQQDGYGEDTTFPEGPARPAEGVQRGAVTDTYYPGDPLTPGWGSTKDAKRLPLKDNPEITKIPTLPISYGDAQPLLQALGGQMVPRAWRGGLPIAYHVGPGLAKVHLAVFSNWDTKPIYDVIAHMAGSTEPDQWVIRGNHQDAWVNGAEDPISGLVAEMEEARALGELARRGWRPRRTILYCAWDGEEPGLLGSTEWVETHAKELSNHAVFYVNSDESDRGFLEMEGSHSIEHFINTVASDVPDPETKYSVLERARLQQIGTAKTEAARTELRQRRDLRIGALGDGSDYSPFLDYLGIPSVDLSFDGETPEGVYHSEYDDFYWYTHFSDTKFVYGRALAQVAGTAVMRMADAEILPYQFTNVADTIHRYVSALEKQMIQTRENIVETDREIHEGVFAAMSDPQTPSFPPKEEQIPPYLNFAPLENGAADLTISAEKYQTALDQLAHNDSVLDGTQVGGVNYLLMLTERATLRQEGLPGRSWYKNQIYAPGAYTGYGVKTLPAVREAMDQHQWQLAEQETPVVGSVLVEWSRAIDASTEKLDAIESNRKTDKDIVSPESHPQ